MKIKTIKQIDIDEWDGLVEQTYGKIYSFQQQDGCQPRGIVNITVPSNYVEDFENTEIPFEVNGEEMGVSFETWLNTTPEETRKHFKEDYQNRLFWDRNFYPSIDMIINDLHSKGLLEEGKYQINIDW
jgi:hypothetical protein